VIGVEQWAEIRRMKLVEGRSIHEIARLLGCHRETVRRALASDRPPSYGPRVRRPSKLDPFVEEIERLLDDEPALLGGAHPRGDLKARLRRRQDDPRRALARAAPALPAAAPELPAHRLPPRRACPVRPLRASGGDPGGLGPDPARLRGHLQAALLARLPEKVQGGGFLFFGGGVLETDPFRTPQYDFYARYELYSLFSGIFKSKKKAKGDISLHVDILNRKGPTPSASLTVPTPAR
jgi:hypothetical protein